MHVSSRQQVDETYVPLCVFSVQIHINNIFTYLFIQGRYDLDYQPFSPKKENRLLLRHYLYYADNQSFRLQCESSNHRCDRSISGTVTLQIERGQTALSIPKAFNLHKRKFFSLHIHHLWSTFWCPSSAAHSAYVQKFIQGESCCKRKKLKSCTKIKKSNEARSSKAGQWTKSKQTKTNIRKEEARSTV